jgi:hypothetical protein
VIDDYTFGSLDTVEEILKACERYFNMPKATPIKEISAGEHYDTETIELEGGSQITLVGYQHQM